MIENGSMLQAHKERRRQEIRAEMVRRGIKIGIFTTKTNHREGCGCWDCLTTPESFCPFPKEHREFYDMLFAAIKE